MFNLLLSEVNVKSTKMYTILNIIYCSVDFKLADENAEEIIKIFSLCGSHLKIGFNYKGFCIF